MQTHTQHTNKVNECIIIFLYLATVVVNHQQFFSFLSVFLAFARHYDTILLRDFLSLSVSHINTHQQTFSNASATTPLSLTKGYTAPQRRHRSALLCGVIILTTTEKNIYIKIHQTVLVIVFVCCKEKVSSRWRRANKQKSCHKEWNVKCCVNRRKFL